MKTETVLQDFGKFLSGIPAISEKNRAALLAEAAARLTGREFSGSDDDPLKRSLYFEQLRAELTKARWSTLDPEERVALMFPLAPEVGTDLEIPNRGRGRVLWRELTASLGLKIGYQMSDGSVFAWEHFD